MPTPPNGDAARAAAGATSKAAAVARQQEAELAVEQRRKAIVASFEAQRRALEAERATRAADVSVAAESPVPVPAAATQTHCWRERLFVPVTPPSLPLPPPPPPRSGAAFSVEKAIAALKTVDDAAACVTLLEGLRSAVSPYGGFGPRQGTSLRERVARNGGVPVVVSALAAHAADRRVVRAASQTLAVLVEGRSADADAACAAGAPAMLVMAALSTREGASGDDKTTAAWCAAALQVRLQSGALPEPKDASLQHLITPHRAQAIAAASERGCLAVCDAGAAVMAVRLAAATTSAALALLASMCRTQAVPGWAPSDGSASSMIITLDALDRDCERCCRPTAPPPLAQHSSSTPATSGRPTWQRYTSCSPCLAPRGDRGAAAAPARPRRRARWRHQMLGLWSRQKLGRQARNRRRRSKTRRFAPTSSRS